MHKVKVQLIWVICHSSLIGNCCPTLGSTFGQLKHAVSGRRIADVPWKVESRVRKWSLGGIKSHCSHCGTCFFFELTVMDHNGGCWNKTRRAEAYAVSQTNQIMPIQGTTHSFTYDPKTKTKKKITFKRTFGCILLLFNSRSALKNAKLLYPKVLDLFSCDQEWLCWHTCHWSRVPRLPV